MKKIAFTIRNLSSFFSNKEGIVLPIVMVFMVISQTVYWGVLHLNQINSQQYKQFQAYYQADIQKNMVAHLLNNDDSRFAFKLESKIYDDLSTQHETMINTVAIDSWLLENPQVGLGRLSSNVDRERLILYQQQLYLDQDQLDYCLIFQSLECFGRLNVNGTYDPVSLTPTLLNADTFDELQIQLIADGFVLNRTLKRNFLNHLPNDDFSEIYFGFNIGNVSINKLNNNFYQYTTQLKHTDFFTSQKVPITITRYLLIWQGYIYERPTPHE